MDNMVIANINGEDRPLNYSIEIMLKVNEKFGGINKALDVIEKDNMAAIQHVRWFAVELANDGELCRRAAGYEPRKMLTLDDFPMQMIPIDYVRLKESVVRAIMVGYGREIDNDEDVDLGLAELHEKKAQAGE